MMTKKRTIFLILALITLGIYGLNIYRVRNTPLDCKVETIYLDNMNDLASEKSIKFETKGSITGIEIWADGEIHGTGILTIGYNDSTAYRAIKLDSGRVDIKHKSDWYSDICYISFTPTSKTKGQIEISCNFIGD